MEKPYKKFLRLAVEYSFYLWVFLLPWQTKLILRPAPTNFTALSLYLSQLLLLVILIVFFIYQLARREEDEPISWLWWCLVGLELGVFCSFFIAPDQVLAFYGYVVLLVGVGLFYLTRAGLAKHGYEEAILDRSKVIYCWFASLFLQAVLGIYQFLSQSTLVSKYLGLAAHDPAAAGTSVVETASGRWLRAYGGFDHPNILGGVLAIALIMAAYLLAKKKMIRTQQEAGESILLFIFYFVALFAVFFTFSRAAWLALVLGFIYLTIIFLRQQDRWVIGRFIALIGCSLIMLFIIAYPYQDLVWTRALDNTRLEQQSLTDRQTYIGEAANLIKQHWLLGVGVSNYTVALERQDKVKHNIWDYQPVHNVFLLLWSEDGLLALLSFLAFLVLLKKNSGWELTGPLLIVLLVLMMCDHWLLSLPSGVLIFFWLCGLM
jgi:O-antigen ligase